MLHLLAGASGYSYKPWKGPFYPAKLPDSEMLAYYAARLPAVEINNTFYRMPKSAVLADWSAKTPKDFRFVLKASRRITHQQRLKDSAETLGYLYKSAEALGDKLGAVLFQLPPNMKKDLDRLKGFLALLPPDQKAAFEFRHDSWFDEAVYDCLRTHDAAFCISEFEDDDKATPKVATARWGYLRLRRDSYADADLEAWLQHLRRQAWDQAFVFFKHEDEGAAPKLAQRLLELNA